MFIQWFYLQLMRYTHAHICRPHVLLTFSLNVAQSLLKLNVCLCCEACRKKKLGEQLQLQHFHSQKLFVRLKAFHNLLLFLEEVSFEQTEEQLDGGACKKKKKKRPPLAFSGKDEDGFLSSSTSWTDQVQLLAPGLWVPSRRTSRC